MEFKQGHELKEFNYLYKEMEDLYHEVALKTGLSDSAFYILFTIAELGDGCLQRDISAMNSMSKQTVNSSIRNLEKRDYIYLKQGRGRDKHIYVTPPGRKFIEDNILPVAEIENSVFSAMSEEETAELLRLTRKYVTIFEEKIRQML